jgi:hypothetical protein
VCPLQFPANKTAQVPPELTQGTFNAVVIELAPQGVAAQLAFSLRLYERSKHAQPIGVDVPVVRPEQFFTGPVRFAGVDATSGNRVSLRVYDPRRSDVRGGGVVRVDVYRVDGSPLATRTLALQYTNADWDPGFAALFDLQSDIPEVGTVPRYDVVVTPISSGLKFYALMSSTHFETQQVLVMTPQQSE